MKEPQACIEARSPAVKYNPLMKKHYEELCKSEKSRQGMGGRRRSTKKARRHRRKTSRR
jgi:hypothetical protein